jgi:hypothetical protein
VWPGAVGPAGSWTPRAHVATCRSPRS